MLTGYQCEVVAFIGDGEFVCYDCAHKALDEGTFARAERGLGDLSPVIRYSLDEYNSERVYEEAEQQLVERVENGDLPNPATQEERWSALEAIVEELGDSYNETCGQCGEVIS